MTLFLLCSYAVGVAETPVYTCDFGSVRYSGYTSSYTASEFTVTAASGEAWTVRNFASDSYWSYVKAGDMSQDVTAEIVNKSAFDAKIARVDVTINKIREYKSTPNVPGVDYVEACRLLVGKTPDLNDD
ncbi:MAG: hypothetical protein NC193_07610, partial [bacterium]|nr:hypothetical protein [bacterium]